MTDFGFQNIKIPKIDFVHAFMSEQKRFTVTVDQTSLLPVRGW